MLMSLKELELFAIVARSLGIKFRGEGKGNGRGEQMEMDWSGS